MFIQKRYFGTFKLKLAIPSKHGHFHPKMQKYSFLSSLLERVRLRKGGYENNATQTSFLIIKLINFCPDFQTIRLDKWIFHRWNHGLFMNLISVKIRQTIDLANLKFKNKNKRPKSRLRKTKQENTESPSCEPKNFQVVLCGQLSHPVENVYLCVRVCLCLLFYFLAKFFILYGSYSNSCKFNVTLSNSNFRVWFLTVV